MLVALCSLLGLLIGSFLNVVIWRVPRDESILRPPSHCPGCDAPIALRDNVPVLSWLLLRGKCRRCGIRISPRYLLVEVGTAALFGLMAWHFGLDPALPAFLYLSAVGIALALIDIDHKRLPFALTMPSYPIALVLLVIAVLVERDFGRLVSMAVGLVGLFGLYRMLHAISPRGMGYGDVMLSGILGLYLGYLGWGPLLVGAFLGFLLGSFGGLALIAGRRAGLKSHVPFGPYMISGALIAVFVGEQIARGYVDYSLG